MVKRSEDFPLESCASFYHSQLSLVRNILSSFICCDISLEEKLQKDASFDDHSTLKYF